MVHYIVTSKPGKQSQMIKRRVFSSDSEVKATDLERVSAKSPHGLAKKRCQRRAYQIALSFQLHLISSETGFLGIIFFSSKKKYMEKLNPFYLSKINTGCEVKHPKG